MNIKTMRSEWTSPHLKFKNCGRKKVRLKTLLYPLRNQSEKLVNTIERIVTSPSSFSTAATTATTNEPTLALATTAAIQWLH